MIHRQVVPAGRKAPAEVSRETPPSDIQIVFIICFRLPLEQTSSTSSPTIMPYTGRNSHSPFDNPVPYVKLLEA